MSGNLIVAVAIFIVSVSIAIGLSLLVITVVLRMQHKHRKRLARVGRRRMSGRLDMEDARLMLLRQKQEKNLIVTLTDALAKFVPLLDTTRLRANFLRAELDWSVATFVSISLGIGAVFVLRRHLRPRQAAASLPGAGPVLRDVRARPLREAARRHARQPLHEAAAGRARHHHPRHPLRPAGHRMHRRRRPGIRRPGRRPLPRDQRAGDARRDARRRALAGGAGHRQAGDGLPRDLDRHPGRDRRQPLGRARQPRRPPAPARADEAQDQGDLVGGQGQRADHRRPALHDAGAADDDEPRLRDEAVHRPARPDDARLPASAASPWAPSSCGG